MLANCSTSVCSKLSLPCGTTAFTHDTLLPLLTLPHYIATYSAFPHGGWSSAGLLLAACGAFATTTYAVVSCRFLEITFETDRGGLEGHFSPTATPEVALQRYKAVVGLYQWLRPIDSVLEWNEGSCVGYQETMLREIQDNYFDMARVFGVIGVLMGFFVLLWSLLTACIVWNWMQLFILRALLLVGVLASGLAFLIVKSSLCDGQDGPLPEASCALDNGALVLIAAMILWMAAFIVAVVFISPYSPNDIKWHGPTTDADIERAIQRSIREKTKPTTVKQAVMLRAENERRREEMAASARRAAGKSSSKHSAVSSPTTPRTLPRSPTGGSDIESDDSINSFENRQKGIRYLQRHSAAAAAASSGQGKKSQRTIRGSSVYASSRISDHRSGRNNNSGDNGRSRRPLPSAVMVDDITSRNELEVYISEKMSRINGLMDKPTHFEV